MSLMRGQPPVLISDALPTVDVPLTSTNGILNQEDSPDLPELRTTPSPIFVFNAIVQLSYISESTAISSLRKSAALAGKHTSCTDRLFDLDEVQMNVQIAEVSEQEAKLAAWRRNLPPHLQFDIAKDGGEANQQHLMILLRSLHSRLLVHRQVFLMVLGRGNQMAKLPAKGYLRSTIIASVEQCADCASQIIAIVTTNQDSRSIGPWWNNIQRN